MLVGSLFLIGGKERLSLFAVWHNAGKCQLSRIKASLEQTVNNSQLVEIHHYHFDKVCARVRVFPRLFRSSAVIAFNNLRFNQMFLIYTFPKYPYKIMKMKSQR